MKKIFSILTLLLLLVGSSKAQVYKFEIDGNMFVLTDTVPDPDAEILFRPSSSMFISKMLRSSSTVYLSTSISPVNLYLPFSSVIDDSGVPFGSFDLMVDWINDNLGGTSGGTITSYNLTADGSTASFLMNGEYEATLEGDFGSGDVILQNSSDNTTWINLNSPTYDSDTAVIVKSSVYFRFTLQNSTSPDLNLSISKLR